MKLKFYSNVLGDNSTFIHYGKWDGLDTDQPGAYGRASEAMTDYMYKLSMGLLPHRAECNDFRYVDLGSGTGGTYCSLLVDCVRVYVVQGCLLTSQFSPSLQTLHSLGNPSSRETFLNNCISNMYQLMS